MYSGEIYFAAPGISPQLLEMTPPCLIYTVIFRILFGLTSQRAVWWTALGHGHRVQKIRPLLIHTVVFSRKVTFGKTVPLRYL